MLKQGKQAVDKNSGTTSTGIRTDIADFIRTIPGYINSESMLFMCLCICMARRF